MPVLNPKQPSEVTLYELSFALAFKQSEDVIQTFTLAVASGSVAIANYWATDTSVYMNVSGGTNGQTSTINLTVVTALGQTLKRTYSLYVSSSAISVDQSTTTKRQLVEMAWEEISLSGYEYDITAEENATALRRLDALMAEWCGPGQSLALPYNFPTVIGGSDLDDASGIPDFACNAVVLSLALRIMPAMAKTMSPETRQALNTGMSAIRAACRQLPQMGLPQSTLRGAGNKPLSTWRPYNGAGNGVGRG